jgi:signal transduction histidine kinase
VELVVWDDGPGMTPAQVSRAFDRFYRADAGRARTGAGSGLGLSIVSAVAAAHEGSVELTSDLDGGTKVTVLLPRQVSSLNEREDNPQDS